ncbi:unnamed protein product [Somion occarium]|uniref:Steroid 5-alpha reductase C-terminal domain-containing protein n=1 Tax=Somion occarium TaxID=3059160 RepID=A0ABP1EC61_9APHY
MAIFSRIAFASYAFQTAAGLIFVPLQEDRFFDLCGSLGFVLTNLVSIYLPGAQLNHLSSGDIRAKVLSPRRFLLNAVLNAWAIRLGSFLLSRALRHGGDSRFAEVKKSKMRFAVAWIAQATWVFAVGLPVYLVNSVPSAADPPLTIADYASLAFLASSWMFELVADYQKSVWRQAKEKKQHDEKFVTRGLWAISRHPNHVGEVGIWTGVWALSIPALKANAPLAGEYTWLVAGISPLTTYLLTRYISGVPPLEKQADQRFGEDPKWKEYKRNVSIFWPWVRPSSD